jgi:hypothetical protein
VFFSFSFCVCSTSFPMFSFFGFVCVYFMCEEGALEVARGCC